MVSIINNLNIQNNHNIIIQKRFNESTDVMIASPFLMNDFNEFLYDLSLDKLKSITLVTTLKPRDKDQIHKVYSLISLKDFCDKNKNIKLKILINNYLHGKVYLFKNDKEYISGIISSANFTDSGLSRNHEWGIELKDKNILTDIEKDVFEIPEFYELEEDDLINFLYRIDEYLENNPKVPNEKIGLDLNKSISKHNKLEYVDDKNYWLKPIGVSENPIPDGKLFDKPIEQLDFSKRRPSGVVIGDIIIAYGVGNGKILSIYEVRTTPRYATENEIKIDPYKERWPWSVEGINLTQIYGRNWWLHNLYITNLKDEFNNSYSDYAITYRGGKTLGALNFGSDKIRLSIEFAKYIIEKVKKLNN